MASGAFDVMPCAVHITSRILAENVHLESNHEEVIRSPKIVGQLIGLDYLNTPMSWKRKKDRKSSFRKLKRCSCAAASHQLSVLNLVVYICQCYSLTLSQLTLPPPHVLKSILYVCVFIPVLPLVSSEPFFLNPIYIYVLAYAVYFSLSDLLHSV